MSSGFPRGRARCVPPSSGSPRARRSPGEPSPAVTRSTPPPPVTLERRPGPAGSSGLTSKGVRGLALAPGPARALRSRRWRETWAARKDVSCRRPGHWRIGGALGDLRTGPVGRRLEGTGPLVPVLHLPSLCKGGGVSSGLGTLSPKMLMFTMTCPLPGAWQAFIVTGCTRGP